MSLSYSDQVSAVQENRFPSSTATTAIPQWLEAAYGDVWNASRWSFKRVSRASWYTTDTGLVGGTATATPDMPDAFGRVDGVFDADGCKLKELTPGEFDYRYAADTTTGIPDTFTVVGRQITLYPTPTSALLYTLSYHRRLSTRTSAGVFQAGFYVADSDIPAWDDHHYILVIRAKIIGLRDRSDPTAGDLEGEYARLLEAMRSDYVETLPRGTRLPAWR